MGRSSQEGVVGIIVVRDLLDDDLIAFRGIIECRRDIVALDDIELFGPEFIPEIGNLRTIGQDPDSQYVSDRLVVEFEGDGGVFLDQFSQGINIEHFKSSHLEQEFPSGRRDERILPALHQDVRVAGGDIALGDIHFFRRTAVHEIRGILEIQPCPRDKLLVYRIIELDGCAGRG